MLFMIHIANRVNHRIPFFIVSSEGHCLCQQSAKLHNSLSLTLLTMQSIISGRCVARQFDIIYCYRSTLIVADNWLVISMSVFFSVCLLLCLSSSLSVFSSMVALSTRACLSVSNCLWHLCACLSHLLLSHISSLSIPLYLRSIFRAPLSKFVASRQTFLIFLSIGHHILPPLGGRGRIGKYVLLCNLADTGTGRAILLIHCM